MAQPKSTKSKKITGPKAANASGAKGKVSRSVVKPNSRSKKGLNPASNAKPIAGHKANKTKSSLRIVKPGVRQRASRFLLTIGAAMLLIAIARNSISQNLPASSAKPTNIRKIVEGEVAKTRAQPARLTSPAINLDVDMAPNLGLLPNGEVETPTLESNQPAWYRYSPLPGSLGPSVLLGHAYNYQGPSVFFNLKDLSAGDEITITMSDSSQKVFTVDKVETYNKNNFPTDTVYGNTDYSALRLVTCGDLDYATNTFPENRVVFGRLK